MALKPLWMIFLAFFFFLLLSLFSLHATIVILFPWSSVGRTMVCRSRTWEKEANSKESYRGLPQSHTRPSTPPPASMAACTLTLSSMGSEVRPVGLGCLEQQFSWRRLFVCVSPRCQWPTTQPTNHLLVDCKLEGNHVMLHDCTHEAGPGDERSIVSARRCWVNVRQSTIEASSTQVEAGLKARRWVRHYFLHTSWTRILPPHRGRVTRDGICRQL